MRKFCVFPSVHELIDVSTLHHLRKYYLVSVWTPPETFTLQSHIQSAVLFVSDSIV